MACFKILGICGYAKDYACRNYVYGAETALMVPGIETISLGTEILCPDSYIVSLY